ncbi:MAG: ATPase, T2SS/T4P/T4SS family [Pseudobdellovibrionaceae bacterium]
MQTENLWSVLSPLIETKEITEIIVNDYQRIFFEKEGQLQAWDQVFENEREYLQLLNELMVQTRMNWNIEHPIAEADFAGFRLQLLAPPLVKTHQLVLRRTTSSSWNLDLLGERAWAPASALQLLKSIVAQRENYLVVGPTGSGKTTVLQALLNAAEPDRRFVLLEDTPELNLPNPVSAQAKTRFDPQGILPPVDLGQLIKASLRLRPDSLCVGEVRGPEAFHLLTALTTGHAGSSGTLHASHPQQALQRLEMMVSQGAPQWSLDLVRKVIQTSLNWVIVCEKNNSGRFCRGIYRIAGLEMMGFTFETVYERS